MNSPVLLRTTILLMVLLLAACGEEPPKQPVVDVNPIGEAIRFLAIAGVLAVIINSVLEKLDGD